jgi:hypothetical protein
MDQDLNKIIDKIDNLSKITNEIIQSFSGKKGSELKLKRIVFLDLMYRIVSNLEGLYLLLKPYNESRELKFPIALVIRACLSDVLTGYYLMSFLKDEKSFNNELKVLGLDYISYLMDMSSVEPSFVRHESIEKMNEIIANQMKFIHNKYKEYIKTKDEGSIKLYSPAEIRQTSKPELFIFKNEINLKPTDKNKFERLFKIPMVDKISYIYPLMRYYAQYQHYSFEARQIIKSDPYENLKFFIQSIFYMVNAIFSFGKVVEADKGALDKINQLLKSFKDFPNALNTD